MAAPLYLQFINGGSASATSVTIPAGHQNGDLLLIFAVNASGATAPSLVAGWTNITNNNGTAIGERVAWKRATSSSEVSGTWTNATDILCIVYRNVSTNKTPINTTTNSQHATGTTSVVYGPMSGASSTRKAPNGSWVIGLGCHSAATDVGAQTPAGMTSRVNASKIGAFDTNGTTWPATTSTTVTVNASGEYWGITVEIYSEFLGPLNNYQFVSVGDGMSVSEKIR